MKNKEIFDFIEEFAPISGACEWDHIGLMVGSREAEATKVVFAMDYTDSVLDYAVKNGANLVITHHPYIFHPISDIDFDSPQGELIVKTIKAGVTVYSAHTNLDFTIGGINDAMMETIGITNQKADKSKCHRYGKLKESMTVEEFFKMVKMNFDAPNSRLILPENVSKTKKISKIGVSSGSFDDDFSWIKEYNVEVLVTGEMKHNQAIDFKNRKIIGISLGHFESENVGIEKLSKIVRDRLGIDTLVTKSCNPFSDL